MSLIQGNTKVSAGGYSIDQSIRFNDDDSAYLTDTLGTATDTNRWTYSVWVKRGALPGTQMGLINSNFASNDTGFLSIQFDSDNTFFMTGFSTRWRQTSQVFRDPSAWYHIIVAVDTDQGTADDRIKIYVNGDQVTSFSTTNNPSSGANLGLNQAAAHELGRDFGGIRYFDGYMAEINFIDGQQLAPTDFGEYNDDGVWISKRFAGTYGSNGFHLKGQDSAALGDDSSGNGNDFTSSGLTSDDQVTDTPTDNYATLNPLQPVSSNNTFSEGNLQSTTNTSDKGNHFSTLGMAEGKYYAECTVLVEVGGASAMIGISADQATVMITATNGIGSASGSIGYQDGGDLKDEGSTTVSWGNSYTTNDVIGIAYDADTGNVWFSKNGVWQASGDPDTLTSPAATLNDTSLPVFFAGGDQSNGTSETLLWNFGQLGFTYTPPTNFSALSTANLSAPTIADGSAYFQTTLYTGTGSTLEVNQSGNSTFQPDLVWVKQRNKVDNHVLTDAVRGAPLVLYPNDKSAELAGTGGIESLDTDGFTLGTWNNVNQSGITAAAWQWLAGNGTASNTDGSITSTVSANTTAGCSVIGYTGNATSGATIGHGLGVAPAMVITKSRSSSSYHWYVYHQSNGATKYMRLNDTSAVFTDTNAWNNTAPTSSVITLGNSSGTNHTGTMIAYAFAEVEGFSKFGSYTGNGSTNGPFVWCDFKPAFVLVKRTNSADNWVIVDSSRNSYNVANLRLYADDTNGDITSTTHDFLSNGLKLRASDGGVNGSGSTYIFMAFAEHPFGGTDVAPVPAR